MKSIAALCTAAALAILIAPLAMADEGPYLRLAAGVGHIDNDASSLGSIDPGYVGAAAIGYNWLVPQSVADVRAEFEASYRHNEFDTSGSQTTESYSAMLNAYADFRTIWSATPYLGVGIGATNLRFETATVDDHDTGFAYQVMGGINFLLGEGLAVGLEYRFLETEKLRLSTSSGFVSSVEYEHHSALLTLTVGF